MMAKAISKPKTKKRKSMRRPPTIAELLQSILRKVNHMAQELDDLTAQVAKNSEVEASALALINGIAARITAAGTDPAKLTALTNELKAKDDELAAAVAANTPAA